jgi:hypothetical protein
VVVFGTPVVVYRFETKDIEEKAVNAVRTFFEDSRVVSTFIDQNDREPFWDGYLYLYPMG